MTQGGRVSVVAGLEELGKVRHRQAAELAGSRLDLFSENLGSFDGALGPGRSREFHTLL
jgi:hypothetical protein